MFSRALGLVIVVALATRPAVAEAPLILPIVDGRDVYTIDLSKEAGTFLDPRSAPFPRYYEPG